MGLRRIPSKGRSGSPVSGSAWIRPVTHEIGNLLAGIRLTTHFLAEPPEETKEGVPGPADVERLATEAGAWVALIRPLREGTLTRRSVAASELLAAARRSVQDMASAPRRIRIAHGRGAPDLYIDPDAVHQLLILLLCGALSAERARARVEVREERSAVVISVIDSGLAIPERPSGPSPRGRELALCVADAVLRAGGGRIVRPPHRRGNRVELWLPRAPRRASQPSRARRSRR